MHDGYLRVATATPAIRVADTSYNGEQILSLIRQADAEKASLVVFPELCLTGYTCGDLFLDHTLQQAAINALKRIIRQTAGLNCICIVGLPFAVDDALYNVAAVVHDGQLLGLVPKTNIPNYQEFTELRYFQSGRQLGRVKSIRWGSHLVPFGSELLFCSQTVPDFKFAVEICEDLWVPKPPSIAAALAGATVICNLSASNEILTKADYRRLLVSSHSARLICAYLYADAGSGESTTDLVFSGHRLMYENGQCLAESPLFHDGLTVTDLDLSLLQSERRRQQTFAQSAGETDRPGHLPVFFEQPVYDLDLSRPVLANPFVPADPALLTVRCRETIAIQTRGLVKRLEHIPGVRAVIGLSGGLDSTLALLITTRAFDLLGRDRSDIIAVTMPGFGTTDRTYQNAVALAQSERVTLREIPIGEAVLKHFEDIGHDPNQRDVTYENAQARERTQVLMDLANQVGGLVVGTGDLSELALGWATYNGDHMSMYHVNCSIPKTLVRHLVRFIAGENTGTLQSVLLDIVETPVSPELLPSENNQITQQTEQLVGPYELHDFFLYYFVRYGFSPVKIARLASAAFSGQYQPDEIRKWLRVFITRFFSQQFKRSCSPDGPKVGRIALSPRGDWRMPSDAMSTLWLDQLADV
jgi:NAD+ synthase (glutamine-hydrolysing)